MPDFLLLRQNIRSTYYSPTENLGGEPQLLSTREPRDSREATLLKRFEKQNRGSCGSFYFKMTRE